MTFDYRSFELRPGGEPPSATKLAMIRANFPRLKLLAAELGLEMASALPRMGIDTRPAHEASKLVRALAPSRARDFQRAAFRAHFVDGRDLSDRAVLGDLIEGVGLTRAQLEQALDGGEYREAVLSDQAEARANGFHGVPQMVMNGHVLPSGMLPKETLLEAAAALARRS